jgi:hypothetical protein
MRMRILICLVVGLIAGLIAFAVALDFFAMMGPPGAGVRDGDAQRKADANTIEVTEYHAPQGVMNDELVDDQLSDKHPEFVAGLVDRRHEGDWAVNASSAVLKLDTPMLLPDADAALLTLRPSYAEAIAGAPSWIKVLPSVNLIDGKAKQFDDGLVAAIDVAHYKGLTSGLASRVSLIERLHQRVGPGSDASAYLAAGLKIAGFEASTARPDELAAWLQRFDANPNYSKPLGFYTWSDELTQVFRFMRFFQQPLPKDKPGLINELAHAIASDARLLDLYKKGNAFRGKLTNPLDTLTLADVHARGGRVGDSQAVAVFPGSGSKETELFRRLFPEGLPPGADLMRELIRAIRSGKVDLSPRPDSGWYEYQIHALETFLMPERGPEHAKLLLTKAYKKRMMEAFQALMTKRRETHAASLAVAAPKSEVPPPLAKIKPRLRVEPCPSYFLRMARSYDFVLNVLVATVGEAGLASVHGLREGGQRARTLLEELRWMREFFYGLHLLSAEDIGMAPALRPDEPVDRSLCEAKASEWLASYGKDADLKVDTRVCVPLYFDIVHGRTRLWATIGVRLAKLDVSYGRPPKIKLAQGAGEWQEVQPRQLEGVEYVIAVDEFVEVEIPGIGPLTRKEFREVCDAYKTKPEIVRALGRPLP